MSANEHQVGGLHYQTATGVQHWDMVIAEDLNYFEGQITKYVMRCRKKNGLQDLQKAQHFIEKYIECWEKIAHKLPATQVVVMPQIHRTQGEVDDEYGMQEFARTQFDADGFTGDGMNWYQCVHCRTRVPAKSPLGALNLHRATCTPPGKTNAP